MTARGRDSRAFSGYGSTGLPLAGLTQGRVAVTREQKLALIIGFMLVMVVGVLLSDHFSHARQSRLAIVEPPEADVHVPAGANPAPFVRTSRQDPPVEPTRWIDDGPAATLRDESPSLLRDEPTLIADASSSTPETFEWDMGIGIPDRFKHLFDRVGNGDSRELARIDHASRDSAQQPISPPRSDPAPVADVPLAWQWHTVRKGETLYGLARRYTGDGNRWPELARRNASRLGADGAVREGVRIEVPAAAPSPAPSTPAARPVSPAPTEPRRYAVKQGDTLGRIAQRELGTVRRQAEIIALNKTRIDDADDIREGMILLLPPG